MNIHFTTTVTWERYIHVDLKYTWTWAQQTPLLVFHSSNNDNGDLKPRAWTRFTHSRWQNEFVRDSTSHFSLEIAHIHLIELRSKAFPARLFFHECDSSGPFCWLCRSILLTKKPNKDNCGAFLMSVDEISSCMLCTSSLPSITPCQRGGSWKKYRCRRGKNDRQDCTCINLMEQKERYLSRSTTYWHTGRFLEGFAILDKLVHNTQEKLLNSYTG